MDQQTAAAVKLLQHIRALSTTHWFVHGCAARWQKLRPEQIIPGGRYFSSSVVRGWNEKLISDAVISISHCQHQSAISEFAHRGWRPQRTDTMHATTIGCSVQVQCWSGSTGQRFLYLSAGAMTERNASVVSVHWQWSPPPVPHSRGSRCFVAVASSWRYVRANEDQRGVLCVPGSSFHHRFVSPSRLGPRQSATFLSFLTVIHVAEGLRSVCVCVLMCVCGHNGGLKAAISPRVRTTAVAGEGWQLFGCWLPVVQKMGGPVWLETRGLLWPLESKEYVNADQHHAPKAIYVCSCVSMLYTCGLCTCGNIYVTCISVYFLYLNTYVSLALCAAIQTGPTAPFFNPSCSLVIRDWWLNLSEFMAAWELKTKTKCKYCLAGLLCIWQHTDSASSRAGGSFIYQIYLIWVLARSAYLVISFSVWHFL